MTQRVWNFGPGPAMLPEPVLERMRDELVDWRGAGRSVAEMGERDHDFIAIASKTRADLRTLLAIPDDYELLFVQGGPLAHDAFVPLNMLRGRASADFVVTGHSSQRALDEARRYCAPRIAANGADAGFTAIPDRQAWQVSDVAAYLHVCLDETAQGVAFWAPPDVGDVPLVADATSTLLAGPLDVTRFGLLVAGAQRNLGLAGLTLVIVRKDLLGGVRPDTPAAFDYTALAKADSTGDPPPAYAIYVAGLMAEWLLGQGGVAAIGRANAAKAALFYAEIDRTGFYRNGVRPADRSRTNVPFTLRDPALTDEFLRTAKAAGLVNLAGDRAVGGLRASFCNAMPLAGVQALVDHLREFERTHG